MRRICSAFLVICLAIVAVGPLAFCLTSKTAAARNLSADNSILESGITILPENAQNFELWDFTPLASNSSNGDRFEGNALRAVDKSASFEFEKFEDAIDITGQSEKALVLWIYIPTVMQTSFNITLYGENDDHDQFAFTWMLESKNFLTQTEQATKNSLVVPGWRKLFLPFVNAKTTLNGEIDTVVLSKLNRFILSQTDEAEEYPAIYSMAIVDNVGYTEMFATQEQSYDVVVYTDFFKNYTTDVVLGDKINLPTFDESFGYAWIGKTKLAKANSGSLPAGIYYQNALDEVKKTTEECDYVWKVKIKKPNGDSKICNFGTSTEKFEMTGTFTIQMVAIATIGTTEKQVAQSKPVSIYVQNVSNAVWFETATLNIDNQHTYSIKFVFDEHWILNPANSANNIEFESSNKKVLEIVSVEYNENKTGGTIVVRGKKAGKATVSVAGEFVRTASNTGMGKKVFEAKLSVNVKKVAKSSNTTMLIVLGSILGAGLVASIAMGAVAIIKHNKMGVK